MRFFCLSLVSASLTLSASIVTSANIQVTAPAVDLRLGSLTSDSKVFLIPERSFYVLPADLSLETLNVGTTYSTSWPGLSTTIQAGTLVDVWLLHFNRNSFILGQQTASVDFQSAILGVAGRSTCLLPNTVCPADTDSYGNAANTYTNIQFLRGLELLLGEDSIRFDTANKLTVKAFTSRLTMDEVRIFTASQVPEPGTALVAAGLLLLALRFRR